MIEIFGPDQYRSRKLIHTCAVADYNQKCAELNKIKHEMEVAEKDLFQPVAWDEFETWLRENDKGRDKNPIVCNKWHCNRTYCEIKFGKLYIGGYEFNDHYTRGEMLHVNFYETWR